MNSIFNARFTEAVWNEVETMFPEWDGISEFLYEYIPENMPYHQYGVNDNSLSMYVQYRSHCKKFFLEFCDGLVKERVIDYLNSAEDNGHMNSLIYYYKKYRETHSTIPVMEGLLNIVG